jgi:hypothetical protein
MFTAIWLSGCGNSCFVGFFNNGNGGVIVSAGSPSPTCSLSQANGTMSAMALKSPVCESCTVQSTEGDSLVVLPNARMNLRFSLKPHQGSHFSGTEGWTRQTMLVGNVIVERQWPIEAENSTPD